MEEKQNTGGKLTYIEELHRKRQNRKIRNTAALALVLAVLVFYFTGTYASAFSALAEAVESVQIFLNRSGSFPAKTGIVEPLQAEVLAGGSLPVDDARRPVVRRAEGGRVVRLAGSTP